MMRTAILCVVGLALLVPARALEAQDAPLAYGFGFVANGPRQFAGVSVHFLVPGLYGLGIYADAKFDPTSDTRDGVLLAGVTHTQATAEFGDQWFRDEQRWTTINVALLYAVTEELRVYLGGGPTFRDGFTEYHDEMMERGDRGFYWIEDPDHTETLVNVMGGAFFRIAPGLFVQFGLESQPRGYTVGLTLSLPRR